MEEVEDLASFTSIIQVVFAHMSDIDDSMFSVSPVEATSANTIITAVAEDSSVSVTLEVGTAHATKFDARRGSYLSRSPARRADQRWFIGVQEFAGSLLSAVTNSNQATSGINGAITRTQREKGILDSVDLFTSDTLKGGVRSLSSRRSCEKQWSRCGVADGQAQS